MRKYSSKENCNTSGGLFEALVHFLLWSSIKYPRLTTLFEKQDKLSRVD